MAVALKVRPAVAADLTVVGRMGAALVQLHHGWDPERFARAGFRETMVEMTREARPREVEGS